MYPAKKTSKQKTIQQKKNKEFIFMKKEIIDFIGQLVVFATGG